MASFTGKRKYTGLIQLDIKMLSLIHLEPCNTTSQPRVTDKDILSMDTHTHTQPVVVYFV